MKNVDPLKRVDKEHVHLDLRTIEPSNDWLPRSSHNMSNDANDKSK